MKRKKEKRKLPESKPKRLRIVPETQKQIPIRDFANGVIISEKDDRMVKLIEVSATQFQTLKASQKNDVRRNFERIITNMPDSFQIKCVSISADLSKQIEKIKENIDQETNEECKQLGEEYLKGLRESQKNNVERKFYIAMSNTASKRSKNDDISYEINKFNAQAERIAASFSQMGNYARPLDNHGTAKALYMLLNRNVYKDEPFEKHYEEVYSRYLETLKDEKQSQIYIKPTEYLAPNTLYFNDTKYVLCDGRYYTYMYIAGDGYPNAAACGWLNMFINTYEGVDLDIYVRKKDRRKTENEIRSAISHGELDLTSSSSDITDSFDSAEQRVSGARLMWFYLKKLGEDIYDVSTVITISGDSISKVNETCDYLEDEARSYDIKLRKLPYQNEEAFISTLPLDYIDPGIEVKAKRNMPQSAVSTMFPFTTFQLIHENGIRLADGEGNTPVIPNFFNTDFVENSLIFLCGMAGAGKTSALELIACHARVLGYPVYIVAPEKEDDYRRLCKALGGQFVSIKPGSPARINIMDILENDRNADMERESISHLEARVDVVFEFLSANYPTMSEREKGFLRQCIMAAYNEKGIYPDNNTLWADKEHTHYKEMPIISDILPHIKKGGRDYETLYYSVKGLTEGGRAYLNGKTNVDVNNKFFVIGTETKSNESKTLSSFLAEDFCQMKIREDRTTKVLYIIDEGWAMLNNEYTAEKMFEDSKILRGYSCMFIFATQQMGDVLGSEKGQAIIKNSVTRIIMKHTDEDVKYISQYIDLSNEEKRRIRSFTKGQALMLANQVRLPIYFNPTDYEQLLTWNDPITLARYQEYLDEKRRIEKEERFKNSIATNMPDLDSLMDKPTAKFSNAVTTEQLVKQLGMKPLNSDEYTKEILKENYHE